ncbi:MAG: HNH endonuclease [Acidimicrobiia bacterium]
MTWTKVDDSLHGHPKWTSTPPSAKALWVHTASWCGNHLTDGHVPRDQMRYLAAGVGFDSLDDASAAAEALVTAGLWEPTDDGWHFHHWLQYNPSRVEILRKREIGAIRNDLKKDRALCERIKQLDKNRCQYCGDKVVWTDRRGPKGGTYDHVDPMLPRDRMNEVSNVVVACRACNSAKRDVTPEQAGMSLRPNPARDALHGARSEPDRSQIAPDSDPRKAGWDFGSGRAGSGGAGPDQIVDEDRAVTA